MPRLYSFCLSQQGSGKYNKEGWFAAGRKGYLSSAEEEIGKKRT